MVEVRTGAMCSRLKISYPLPVDVSGAEMIGHKADNCLERVRQCPRHSSRSKEGHSIAEARYYKLTPNEVVA